MSATSRRRGGEPALDPQLAALRRQIGAAAWADRVAQARAREQIVREWLALRAQGVAPAEAGRHFEASVATLERWATRLRRDGRAGLIVRQGSIAAPRRPAPAGRPRSRRRPSSRPRTFVKWAGSKLNVMARLLPLVPRDFHTYYEPMVGAGTVFFALRPARAVLGDINPELITCYEVIRDRVEPLLRALARHRNTYDDFLRVRAQAPADLDPVARAARFIFLNKTCYNGLYRVNSRGRFNVPYGRNPDANLCDGATLRRLAAQLQGVTLRVGDYRATLADAGPRDFVYLDPPYYAPSPRHGSGIRYQADRFDPDAHTELAAVVHDLDRRGCHVMLSNADAPAVRRLYAGYRIAALSVRRTIHRSAAHRGGFSELVITNARAPQDRLAALVRPLVEELVRRVAAVVQEAVRAGVGAELAARLEPAPTAAARAP